MLTDHGRLKALSDAGVIAFGTDYRPESLVWGEGMRSTFLLFYVVEGRVVTEDKEAEAFPGEVLCVPPERPKRLMNPDGCIRAAWFHNRSCDPWKGLGVEYVVQGVPYAQLMYHTVDAIDSEVMSNMPVSDEAIERMGLVVFHYLMRMFRETDSPDELALRRRLVDLWRAVSDCPDEHWTVPVMAEQMNMSEGYFHRLVHRLFGETPMHIVRRLRIERAVVLLKTTNLSLSCIAEMVGYKTSYALSNAFVKQVGKRPACYRA